MRAQINGNSIQLIALQEQKRVEDTLTGLRTIGANEQDLALLRPRLQQAANLRIYQEYRSTIQSMGEDFSSLWDDITSGNIGKLAGSKLGGTPAALGAGLLGLIGATAAGSSTASSALSTLAKPLSALFGAQVGAVLGGVGGGLVGFGIGQQYGTGAGILSGAGSGALTGFIAGGPIGAVIGGIIGLIGGLFGGLFGGSKRRKQAETFGNQQISEIHKLVASYKGFQIDYASAVGQLDTMQAQAQQQLGQLKGEGKKEFQRVLMPEFTRARQDIEGLEHERERRLGLVFAPPQFASGGWTGAGGPAVSGTNGGFLAVLHPNEYVVNRDATSRYLPQLEAMNRGQAASEPNITLHLHTMDAKSLQGWLRNGGAREINLALTRARKSEGGF
jgi:hypothetical protein